MPMVKNGSGATGEYHILLNERRTRFDITRLTNLALMTTSPSNDHIRLVNAQRHFKFLFELVQHSHTLNSPKGASAK
jgi:hypothetical protein